MSNTKALDLPPHQYFGTDGIRGKVGEWPITPEFVLRLGWALGKILARSGFGKVVIGKDTRISGYSFEAVLEAGLSSAGIDSLLLGPMPTPAIAYLTRAFHAQAGIVVSASHNPYYDNGIKFFGYDGHKISYAVEAEIEAELEKPMVMVDSAQLGKATRIEDAPGRYIEFCKSTIPFIKVNHLKIVVDCANGATYHVAPIILRELGAQVIPIANHPDGLNINLNCGATAPQAMQKAVLKYNADLGIAFDGDGDRVVMCDHLGNLLEGDELLYIIIKHSIELNRMQGGVVGTWMTNLALEEALNSLGIILVRTPIGDQHVMAELQARQWHFGGENCGHIICSDRTTCGDGIVTALQILYAMCESKLALAELNQLKKYPQEIINVPVKTDEDPNSVIQVQEAIAAVEKKFGGHGRVLIRHSGTQDLIRVMVEGEDRAMVKKYVGELADLIKKIYNSH